MIDLTKLVGKSAEEILEILKAEREAEQKASRFSDAGIAKTKNGELMVTVSSDRWPITLGRDEWVMLLTKADTIAEALKELGIIQLTKEQRKALKEAAK